MKRKIIKENIKKVDETPVPQSQGENVLTNHQVKDVISNTRIEKITPIKSSKKSLLNGSTSMGFQEDFILGLNEVRFASFTYSMKELSKITSCLLSENLITYLEIPYGKDYDGHAYGVLSLDALSKKEDKKIGLAKLMDKRLSAYLDLDKLQHIKNIIASEELFEVKESLAVKVDMRKLISKLLRLNMINVSEQLFKTISLSEIEVNKGNVYFSISTDKCPIDTNATMLVTMDNIVGIEVCMTRDKVIQKANKYLLDRTGYEDYKCSFINYFDTSIALYERARELKLANSLDDVKVLSSITYNNTQIPVNSGDTVAFYQSMRGDRILNEFIPCITLHKECFKKTKPFKSLLISNLSKDMPKHELVDNTKVIEKLGHVLSIKPIYVRTVIGSNQSVVVIPDMIKMISVSMFDGFIHTDKRINVSVSENLVVMRMTI